MLAVFKWLRMPNSFEKRRLHGILNILGVLSEVHVTNTINRIDVQIIRSRDFFSLAAIMHIYLFLSSYPPTYNTTERVVSFNNNSKS